MTTQLGNIEFDDPSYRPNKINLLASDTPTERERKYTALLKIQQQTIGRFDCYRALENMGLYDAVEKLKDIFNDRKDYP